ncbi:MAG: transglycosylase family protein [Cellulomonadaceae bacterium]|jgi:uncharacterized protein YabE (DUF348 family)|nr:transglycosylase family protein [Cellulomonadaceae bacterium]
MNTNETTTASTPVVAEASAATAADTGATMAEHTAAEPVTSGRSFYRRRSTAIAGAAAAAVILAGGAVGVNLHKSVTLDVDGQITHVSTFAGSVNKVLESKSIRLGEHDTVVPAASAPLRDGSEIVVRYGREVTLSKDGKESTSWIHAVDAAEALQSLSSRDQQITLVASRSGNRAILALPLDSDKPVAIISDSTTKLVTTADGSLDEILSGAAVTLKKNDTVEVVDASTIKSLQHTDVEVAVLVHRVTTTQKTTVKAVPFKKETKKDDTILEGESEVVQPGQDGEETIVKEIHWVDGEKVGSKVISDDVTKTPVTEITAEGTKKAPVEEPADTASSSSGSKDSKGSGSSAKKSSSTASKNQGSAPDGVWGKLAKCESGGNPSIVSSNGLYHGLYQFSVGTWHSLGGKGLPSQASAAEQTRIAKKLQARSGWGQWPACSRKIGVR